MSRNSRAESIAFVASQMPQPQTKVTLTQLHRMSQTSLYVFFLMTLCLVSIAVINTL